MKQQGEVPDALFDPQFASNEEDFRFCKTLAKGLGKGKDKAKGKGKPAVGGKGRHVLARGLPFESNILYWTEDGTWYCRKGICLSLAHLFAKCGRRFTAATLYEYYNLCRTIASKRPHAW